MSGCEETREMLIAVARGESVSAKGESFLRDHVEACPECGRRLASERTLTEGLAAVAASTEAVPSVALKSALLSEFRRQRKITPIRRRTFHWAALAAAVAAALVVAILLMRPAHEERRSVVKIQQLQPSLAAPVPETVAPATPAPVLRAVVKARPVRRPKPAPKPESAAPSEEPAEIASDFFQIPYAEPLRPEERADVFRIEMPRAGMAVYGLPVTGGRLDSRIKADVVMGEDGVARAIRFIR